MFWNKPKKSYEADLSPKTRLQNARFLYKQMGSPEFVKSLPKYKRAKMRRYNMEVAKAYDRDLYEGNDVNRGLQEINKKYGFPTFSQSFLSDIAEFERGRKIKLKKSERVSSLGGQKSILNNQAIKGSLLYEDPDPFSNPDSFSKMKLYPRGMVNTFNVIPKDSKGILHSIVTTKKSNNKFVSTPRYLKNEMLTDLKNAGVNVSRIKGSSPLFAEGYRDVREGVKKMYNERNQTKVSTKSKPTVITSVTPNKPTVKQSVTTNNITKTVTNNVKPPKLNKYLAVTGVAALGGLGYLGYKKLTNKKRRNK